MTTYKDKEGKPEHLILLEYFDLALPEVSKVCAFGMTKYERGSFVKVLVEDYMEAQIRHISEHVRGRRFDDESTLLHLSHNATNALMALQNYLKLAAK